MASAIKEVKSVGHLINGVIKHSSGSSLDIYNPAKGSISRSLNLATKETVEKAIISAEKAFPYVERYTHY